jgi:hypothetical protein
MPPRTTSRHTIASSATPSTSRSAGNARGGRSSRGGTARSSVVTLGRPESRASRQLTPRPGCPSARKALLSARWTRSHLRGAPTRRAPPPRSAPVPRSRRSRAARSGRRAPAGRPRPGRVEKQHLDLAPIGRPSDPARAPHPWSPQCERAHRRGHRAGSRQRRWCGDPRVEGNRRLGQGASSRRPSPSRVVPARMTCHANVMLGKLAIGLLPPLPGRIKRHKWGAFPGSNRGSNPGPAIPSTATERKPKTRKERPPSGGLSTTYIPCLTATPRGSANEREG